MKKGKFPGDSAAAMGCNILMYELDCILACSIQDPGNYKHIELKQRYKM